MCRLPFALLFILKFITHESHLLVSMSVHVHLFVCSLSVSSHHVILNSTKLVMPILLDTNHCNKLCVIHVMGETYHNCWINLEHPRGNQFVLAIHCILSCSLSFSLDLLLSTVTSFFNTNKYKLCK